MTDSLEIFPDFPALFAEAATMGVTVAPLASTILLSAVLHLAAIPAMTDGQRAQAQADWTNLLQQKQGQMLTVKDVWGWLKKILFPDPVRAALIWNLIVKRWQGIAGLE